MLINKQYLINNECYIKGKKLIPKGIMLHSTGANNPNLSRYVQPDDGYLGENKYNNHWNQYRPGGRQVCPHAFIGLDKYGDVTTYQTLPWEMVGWHCAGKGNDQYIGIEICEDDLKNKAYFTSVYNEAVQVFAWLCKEYNINPYLDGAIICHSEGFQRNIASNHGDVMHWFPKFGVNMDVFRYSVQLKYEEMINSVPTRYNTIEQLPEWAKLDIKYLCDYGVLYGKNNQLDDEGYPTSLDLTDDMARVLCTLSRSFRFVLGE